jgi:hypothetical protein
MMPTGSMALVTNDRSFLAEQPWVDPCADAIWTEPDDQDRGYRDVVLDRAQFLAAIEARMALASHERQVSPGRVDAVTNESGTRSAPTASPPAPASIRAEHSRSRGAVKRKGGRPAHWVKCLKEYLRFRLKHGDDIYSMTLKEIRWDFSSHATHRQISGLPKSRSAFEAQTKRVLSQVAAEHQEREQRDRKAEPPLSEIVSAPEIRR